MKRQSQTLIRHKFNAFIFLTASVENKEILEGLKMGANEYLCKPYEFNDLLAAIERCLKK